MNAADTNVLVRLIVRDDARQTSAAERFIETGIWVSTLVLAEALWVVRKSYGFSPTEMAATVEMLLSEKDVTFEDADVVEAALDLFRARPALKFSDCLILELARKAGHLPLGTFDLDLGKIPGTQRL
jgi:predicted nucleic-acid-binding protein